jgi:hypothetical protein
LVFLLSFFHHQGFAKTCDGATKAVEKMDRGNRNTLHWHDTRIKSDQRIEREQICCLVVPLSVPP